mgnify:CR=1 FL=1
MAVTRWEYRILHDLTAPELNPLGEDGWEFVTVEFDDDGEILNAFAKRPMNGGGQPSSTGGGGGQGGGGGGPGNGGRRRRRRTGGAGGKGGGQGGGDHRIGPMT